MESLNWMAWTWQTATFFGAILVALAVMTFLAVKYPEAEKVGALMIATTRGDRLFLSLLFAAIIHILWIAFAGASLLWIAGAISLVVAVAVFRYV